MLDGSQRSHLDALADGDPLRALRGATALRPAVAASARAERAVAALARAGDATARLLAPGALAGAGRACGSRALLETLTDGSPQERAHAALAQAERPPDAAALAPLVELVAGGGFAADAALLALETWGAQSPDTAAAALAGRLTREDETGARARLLEALGAVPGTASLLSAVLRDPTEPSQARAAAADALAAGRIDGLLPTLVEAARGADGVLRLACARALVALPLAEAHLAARSLALAVAGSTDPHDLLLVALVEDADAARPAPGPGLHVWQVLVQGRLDGELSGGGAGDGGGLATLLVTLARELAALRGIGAVTTITRACAGEHEAAVHRRAVETLGHGASIERLAFGPPGHLPAERLWSSRLELERSLERLLRRLGRPDVVHLRFADVGALAAARVARRAGIPFVFTLAPDPHGPMRTAVAAGELTRETFPDADRRERLVFRARLVESLAADADALALLPRPRLAEDLEDLLGVRPGGRRIRVVPEGIGSRATLLAAREARAGREAAVLAELRLELSRLGAARARLPLLVSVGRLHRVKGFARLVEAWAGEPALHRGFNLVLVGGDLAHPSPEESRVLGELEGVVGALPHARDGLVLFGHRPHDDVARVLHAARHGVDGVAAPGGVYACASLKEEFGLALLEAMAAGLSIVGPAGGGPATYVEDGVSGVLADTASVAGLREGLLRASASRHDQLRAARAVEVARAHTAGGMARALADLYAGAAAATEPAAS